MGRHFRWAENVVAPNIVIRTQTGVSPVHLNTFKLHRQSHRRLAPPVVDTFRELSLFPYYTSKYPRVSENKQPRLGAEATHVAV